MNEYQGAKKTDLSHLPLSPTPNMFLLQYFGNLNYLITFSKETSLAHGTTDWRNPLANVT